MGFETKVLETVSEITHKDHSAEFSNGTLYVDCSETEADTIVRILTEHYNIGRVKVSKIGEDFAFNFA